MSDRPAVGPERRVRLRHRSILAVGAVVALGLTGTVLAALSMRDNYGVLVERALDSKRQLITQTVEDELDRYQAALHDLAAAVGAQQQLEADEFMAITAPITQRRLPGAVAVGFLVPATDGDVSRVQEHWRQRGSTNLTLRPAADTAEHYFSVVTRPLDGSAAVPGGDAAAAPEAVQALTAARTSREVAASPPYRLLRDARLPTDQKQWSFLLAAPVFATSPPAAAGEFRGWVVMALRGGDFLQTTIGRVAGVQATVVLSDSVDTRVTVASYRAPSPVDPDVAVLRNPVTGPQRTWVLTVQATQDLIPGNEAHLDEAAATVGGLITALLALLTATIVTSRNRALRQVADATAALRDDIERREDVERKLRQREQELVAFAGIVAHDLRRPLSNISANAEILADEAAPGLSEEHRQFLDRLRTATARMRDLIDDLLTYATADNAMLRLSEVDLDSLLRDIVDEPTIVRGGPSPIVRADPLPHVRADPRLIRQVLDNLIGNAVKYTPPGQRADVTVTSLPHGPGWCRIDVADRGIGVPDDHRDQIFEAFHRAEESGKYQGTGLGLAIVRRIVERHGGTVGVEANSGGGSRFWFTLPATDASARQPGTLARPAHTSPPPTPAR